MSVSAETAAFRGPCQIPPASDDLPVSFCGIVLPPAWRKSLSRSPVYEVYHYQKGHEFALEFQFKDGMYLTRQEYIVYDTDSPIAEADVGGYLGLLLGHSTLSIYSSLVEWLPKSRNKIWKQLN